MVNSMTTLSIPISKAGKGVTFDIESEDVEAMLDSNPGLMQAMVFEYFKTMLNAKMSKLPAPTKLSGEEAETAKTEALAKAAENYAEIKSGKVAKRTTSKSASKEPKEVLTEALRQCKEVVRDRLKAAKKRISTVPAKLITEAAKKLLAEREEFYIAKAKAAIDARLAEDTAEVDVLSIAQEDPKKVAELEAEKAKRKAETLSKTQAGLPLKRAGKGKGPVPVRKGDTPAHTAH
jgi:predicted DNA-binding protein